jgi:hypothetical protein
MGDTVDKRSLNDGYSAEVVVTGEACGRHYMVTVRIALSVNFLIRPDIMHILSDD